MKRRRINDSEEKVAKWAYNFSPHFHFNMDFDEFIERYGEEYADLFDDYESWCEDYLSCISDFDAVSEEYYATENECMIAAEEHAMREWDKIFEACPFMDYMQIDIVALDADGEYLDEDSWDYQLNRNDVGEFYTTTF